MPKKLNYLKKYKKLKIILIIILCMDNFIYRNYISSLTVFYIREANLNQIFTHIYVFYLSKKDFFIYKLYLD